MAKPTCFGQTADWVFQLMMITAAYSHSLRKTSVHDIKDISPNPRKFEICLKYFHHTHYFYSIDEYFQYKAIANQ
jgi:hypothetical protein